MFCWIISIITGFLTLPIWFFSSLYFLIVVGIVTFLIINCNQKICSVCKQNIAEVEERYKERVEKYTSIKNRSSKAPIRILPDNILMEAIETSNKTLKIRSAGKKNWERINSPFYAKKVTHIISESKNEKVLEKDAPKLKKKKEKTIDEIKEDANYVDLAQFKDLKF